MKKTYDIYKAELNRRPGFSRAEQRLAEKAIDKWADMYPIDRARVSFIQFDIQIQIDFEPGAEESLANTYGRRWTDEMVQELYNVLERDMGNDLYYDYDIVWGRSNVVNVQVLPVANF